MPTALSTDYMGSCSAAVLLSGGLNTRIYYQGADSAIHEAAGSGAAVKKPTYTDRVVVPASLVRINSPIAAVAWTAGNGVQQIRLYFIDKSNLLHEYCGTSKSSTTGNWGEGYLTGQKHKAAVNSGVLYAIFTEGPSIRVGYQAADTPDRITETNNTGGWNQGSFA